MQTPFGALRGADLHAEAIFASIMWINVICSAHPWVYAQTLCDYKYIFKAGDRSLKKYLSLRGFPRGSCVDLMGWLGTTSSKTMKLLPPFLFGLLLMLR